MMESFTADPMNVKDFALGFFIALSLRRKRLSAVIERFVPAGKSES